MKKEFTVHFKVIHHDRSSLLRGILFLEEDQQPTLNDYEQCLRDCGHDVVLLDKEHFIYKASKPDEEYIIHVLEDKTKISRDLILESLVRNLMAPN
ncbi:hypothetical protein Back11_57960 [Paenibacillus baekrokdamisoli]|uniref:Uncharacterized protein n=1 Tax=Paenibacillus baekrokdamisoli TaxID=1712516 RepID=A0A3G9JEW1_9BACL|nr:hypothetical protein [Paenibacillus baekrokdamisoli]MBB3072893.1 hypothetical protein [Paenibacillus baekrokdamisoli]BBH24451.1 hypothetical protein Back11_57960 [Paenibacillus baekrokdamisoli]